MPKSPVTFPNSAVTLPKRSVTLVRNTHIETCKLNGIEPYAYLRDVLQRINDHRQDRLEELLPMYWKPA